MLDERQHNVFEEDLTDDNGINSWKSDDEFLCKYKVNHDQLKKTLPLLQTSWYFLDPAGDFLRCL
jgi:hypothetical protein